MSGKVGEWQHVSEQRHGACRAEEGGCSRGVSPACVGACACAEAPCDV